MLDKYSGSASEVLNILNEQKPQDWELLALLKAACANNDKNVLDALLEYKKGNESVFYGIRYFYYFTVEEIKQYFDTLIKYLQPNIILNNLLSGNNNILIYTLQDGKNVIDAEKLKCVGELIASLVKLGAVFDKLTTPIDLDILHAHIALFIDKNIISMEEALQKVLKSSTMIWDSDQNKYVTDPIKVETQAALIAEFLNKGFNINSLANHLYIEIETLKAHKDLLLNHPINPLNPDNFLKLLLKSSIMTRDSAQNKNVIDPTKVDIQGKLIAEVLERAFNIDNALDSPNTEFEILKAHKDLLLNHPINPLNPDNFLKLLLQVPTKSYDLIQRDWVIDQEKSKLKLMYLQEAIEMRDGFPNTLTIYHDTGHAFVKLECSSCSDGKPAIITAGLYPPNDEITCPLSHEDYHLTSPHSNNELLNAGSAGSFSISKGLLGSGSYAFGLHSLSYAKFPKSGAQSSALGYIKNLLEKYHPTDKYNIGIEQLSFVMDKEYHIEHNFAYENINDIPSRSFNITTNGASNVLNKILYLANHCDNNYSYQAFGNNCIDFAQQIYNLAELKGDHFEEMYSGSYPFTPIGAYKTLDTSYNFVSNVLDNTLHQIYDFFG